MYVSNPTFIGARCDVRAARILVLVRLFQSFVVSAV